MSRLPDPTISANLYASGLLDSAITGFLLPVANAIRMRAGEDECLIWIMRYLKRGEHLKIRVHCHCDAEADVRRIVQLAAETFLQQVGTEPMHSPRPANPRIPAIDVEDEHRTPAEDRTFLWTHYRRTPVVYPSAPWLADSDYVGLASCCLAAGCEQVLELWASEAPPLGARQNRLALMVGRATAAIGCTDLEACRSYFTYHRDWLLRFFIVETERERQTLERFGRSAGAAPTTVDRLARMLEDGWRKGREYKGGDAWYTAMHRLGDYVQSRPFNSEYDIDPFARVQWFPPVFKALHAVANQFGIPPMEEAYVYHLLLTAVERTNNARGIYACAGEAV